MQEQANQEKLNENENDQNNSVGEHKPDDTTEEIPRQEKITPDTIVKMENEKKELEEEHNIYHVHYIINGDAQINTGEIYGNMSQENQKASERIINSMDDVQKILGTDNTVDEFQMLIVLCVLTIVPDNHFITLVNELKKCWGQSTGEEIRTVSPYLSTQDILKLGAEKVVVSFYDESGKSEINCYHLKNTVIADGVKQIIWVDYPVIRNYVLQWMFQIVRMNVFRNLILNQVGEAFQELALKDYNFTKMQIINVFMKRGKSDDYYFLRKIMEKFLESDIYKKNAIHLMKHWCASGNQKQRNMVYSLYKKGRDDAAAESIQKSLIDIIEKELCNGKILFDETGGVADVLFSQTRNINFRTLQENCDAAVLYVQALIEIFDTCTNFQKKVFGFYFCHIFLLDFFYEGYPRYQMMFISMMKEKEIRELLLPLYHYVWRKKVYRHVLEETLNYYLEQLGEKGYDWTYTKAFFRSLSFTGEKTDFDNTVKMLNKMEQKGNLVAKQICMYLQSLLKQRMKEKER